MNSIGRKEAMQTDALKSGLNCFAATLTWSKSKTKQLEGRSFWIKRLELTL